MKLIKLEVALFVVVSACMVLVAAAAEEVRTTDLGLSDNWMYDTVIDKKTNKKMSINYLMSANVIKYKTTKGQSEVSISILSIKEPETENESLAFTTDVAPLDCNNFCSAWIRLDGGPASPHFLTYSKLSKTHLYNIDGYQTNIEKFKNAKKISIEVNLKGFGSAEYHFNYGGFDRTKK